MTPAPAEAPSQYYQNINNGSTMDAVATMGAGNYTSQDLSNQGWAPISQDIYNQKRGITSTTTPPTPGTPGTQPGTVAPATATPTTSQQPAQTPTTPTNSQTPPIQGATTGTDGVQDINAPILSYLQNGYDNVNDIATKTGMNVVDVQKYIDNTPTASYLLKENNINNQLDAGYKDFVTQMNSISQGTFTLTPGEQAQIDAVNQMYQQLHQEQIVANKNYEGTVGLSEIRSGRQEFMAETSAGNYKQAVDNGIQKIKQLDLEAVSKVQQLKDAFADKRYKQVTLLYDALNKNIQDKKDQIQNIYSATNDLYKSVQDKTKADLAAAKLNQTVDLNTIQQLSPMLVNSLNGDAAHDDPIYASYAKNYGLDENLLRGGVSTLTNKTDATKQAQDAKTAADDQNYIQSLLKGGYQTINPADVARMRASGNNVIEYKGRAYMIPQKLTSKTYKGVTTWYDAKGNVVKTNAAPVSSSNGPKKTIPANTEKAAVTEMNAALGQVTGTDGYVSPDSYVAARKQWTDAGLSATTFDTKFKGYKNPNNPNYVTNKQK